jgi:hypothetical protein
MNIKSDLRKNMLTKLLLAAVAVLALAGFIPEGRDDMPPSGVYDSFPGHHSPRLTIEAGGYSISSHIARCEILTRTVKHDKKSDIFSFDAHCGTDKETWLSHEQWKVFRENGEVYITEVSTIKGRTFINLWIRQSEAE